MNFSDNLLSFLFYYSGGLRYRKSEIKRLTYQEWKKEIKETTLKNTLTRLKNQGLVKNKNRTWEITEKGKKYISAKLKNPFRSRGPYDISNNKTKNMIIAFDIPEYRRKTREWLRNELRLLDFEPMQKSVWFGPFPLPQKFIMALSELGIIQNLKFFKATEKEIV